jgi:hypothetical protein
MQGGGLLYLNLRHVPAEVISLDHVSGRVPRVHPLEELYSRYGARPRLRWFRSPSHPVTERETTRNNWLSPVIRSGLGNQSMYHPRLRLLLSPYDRLG